MTNATYQSADDCPLGEAHGTASTHGNANNERCCDFCGFPVAQATNATPGPVEVRRYGYDDIAYAKVIVDDVEKGCTYEDRVLAVRDWLARHRIEALADAAAEAEPVGYIIAEMLNRRREYESNGIVMTATPQGMSTLPLYTAPSSQRALVDALEVFRSFGCPVCNGDCSGANPPVMTCPMQMADRALSRAKATGDGL